MIPTANKNQPAGNGLVCVNKLIPKPIQILLNKSNIELVAELLSFFSKAEA